MPECFLLLLILLLLSSIKFFLSCHDLCSPPPNNSYFSMLGNELISLLGVGYNVVHKGGGVW